MRAACSPLKLSGPTGALPAVRSKILRTGRTLPIANARLIQASRRAALPLGFTYPPRATVWVHMHAIAFAIGDARIRPHARMAASAFMLLARSRTRSADVALTYFQISGDFCSPPGVRPVQHRDPAPGGAPGRKSSGRLGSFQA
jgi:hypothetical protein